MSRSKHRAAKHLLASQRQMTSLIDKEIISSGSEFAYYRKDWVPLYYDTGYAVTSDCGKLIAYRAATLRGQLLWLVFHPNKKHGFHAIADDPLLAMDHAQAAWARRAHVRKNWSEVEDAARDLIIGRQNFTVSLEVADASPLCALGIEGFMRSIGMARVRHMPGRLAALLMRLEPQIGFVIYEALQRHRKATDHGFLLSTAE